MKILRGYQKQTRAGDGKRKPQFPRPKELRPLINKQCLMIKVHLTFTLGNSEYLK